MNSIEKLYDIPEAAKIWGISVPTVRANIFAQKIEIIRIGRRVKIPHSEMVRIVEEGRQPRKINEKI